MARQGGMSTPIFDQLLREMTEGTMPPGQPAPPANPKAKPNSNEAEAAPAPRRRHRAD